MRCGNWTQIWLQVHTVPSPEITLLFTHFHNCGAHSKHVPKYVWLYAFTVVITKGRSSLQWVVWTVGKISHRADTTCVTVTQPPTHHMDYNQLHFGRGYCSTQDQTSRRCSSFFPQALRLLACLLPLCVKMEKTALPPPSAWMCCHRLLFTLVWDKLIYTKCFKNV